MKQIRVMLAEGWGDRTARAGANTKISKGTKVLREPSRPSY